MDPNETLLWGYLGVVVGVTAIVWYKVWDFAKPRTEYLPDGYRISKQQSIFRPGSNLSFEHNNLTGKETVYSVNLNAYLIDENGDGRVEIISGGLEGKLNKKTVRLTQGTEQTFQNANEEFKRVKELLLSKKSEKGHKPLFPELNELAGREVV